MALQIAMQDRPPTSTIVSHLSHAEYMTSKRFASMVKEVWIGRVGWETNRCFKTLPTPAPTARKGTVSW